MMISFIIMAIFPLILHWSKYINDVDSTHDRSGHMSCSQWTLYLGNVQLVSPYLMFGRPPSSLSLTDQLPSPWTELLPLLCTHLMARKSEAQFRLTVIVIYYQFPRMIKMVLYSLVDTLEIRIKENRLKSLNYIITSTKQNFTF